MSIHLQRETTKNVFNSRPTPYVASLRIYEPSEVFPEVEKLRWAKLPTNINSVQNEQIGSLKSLITSQIPVWKQDGVHILEVEGRKYCCPWSTLNRCFNAFFDFKAAIPDSIFPYFINAKFENQISEVSDLVQDKVPHIKTETWKIPPRWFGLFKPQERIFGHNETGAFVVLRTNILDAKKRCKYMHKVVLGTFGVGPIENEIRELLGWLSNFNYGSIVELDYGGLAIFMEKVLKSHGLTGLENDSSVEDLQHSLAGLASADGNKAGQGYERLVTRWRNVAAFEQSV